MPFFRPRTPAPLAFLTRQPAEVSRPRYDHHVRITVAHTKSKEEIKRAIDRTFEDVFKGIANMPVQIVDEKRAWNGDTLFFSFGAKVSLLTSPIKGTIEVTERDVIIDADLGLLEKLLPAAQTKATIENRVRGLLT
jgi:hypothetical protein